MIPMFSQRASSTKHINVYGPMASGKTRYAERLRQHFKCKSIIDTGKIPVGELIELRGPGPHLVLTIEPIRAYGFRNVQISNALAQLK